MDENITKIVVDRKSKSNENLSFICQNGLNHFEKYVCKACGTDLKPTCQDEDCKYVQQAKAFCKKYV